MATNNQKKSAIFVDGANVAREYEIGKTFSVIGLLRCAVYFRQREYTTKIILHRNWRAIAAGGKLEDGDQLLKLENASSNVLAYTPIGVTDKEYLVQLAHNSGGVLVSNDDFAKEKEKRHDWSNFVSKRQLPFQFVNHEFIPTPPIINNRPVDVEEFLNTPYESESGLSSAAALADYLLTACIDGNQSRGESVEVHRDHRRRRHDPNALQTASAPLVQRRYMVGKIVNISPESGSIEFRVHDGGEAIVTKFGHDSYHRQGRPISDFRREFSIGEWVAFISVKSNDDNHRHWHVIEVRKKGEMKRGYGRFKPLSKGDTLGIIEPRYKSESGGGDVFFPGAALREQGVLLENLRRGHWLYYFAFNQKPSAGCTAVAVEAYTATAPGVIVKKTETHVYVWSVKIGLGQGEPVHFCEGTWVKFSFQQQRGDVKWAISDVEVIPTPDGVTVETDRMNAAQKIIIHARCPAVLGVIGDKHGTMWTEAFGRLTLHETSLKQLKNLEPSGLRSYQPVRVWITYNAKENEEEEDSGEEMLAAAARPHKPVEKDWEPWRVISCIVSSSAAASGAKPPYPPRSIHFGVEARVMYWENNEKSERGEHLILKSEQYGTIFASPMDVVRQSKQLAVGDRVKASIVPQFLSIGDEYRAFVVETVEGNICPAIHPTGKRDVIV